MACAVCRYEKHLQEKIAILRAVPSFGQCTLASIQAMASRCTRRRIAAATTLIQQGETSSQVYFCIRGTLHVKKSASDSDNNDSPKAKSTAEAKSEVLKVLGAGACFVSVQSAL